MFDLKNPTKPEGRKVYFYLLSRECGLPKEQKNTN